MELGSPVDRSSDDYVKNRQTVEEEIVRLRTLRDETQAPGSSSKVERHKAKGRLLARERIERVLDLNSPFLEIGRFAGCETDDETPPGAGVVAGIGLINGIFCAICANDSTVKGGSYFPLTVKKHLRLQQIALENQLPCLYLVDSAGAFLPRQSEVFPDREHFGRIFFNQAQMSARNIPQLAVVHGTCTAGGAYVPAMSDQTIIVRDAGTIFLGGPPLVKAATGEEVSAEELGGALVHGTISGVADYIAENDDDALMQVRQLIADLNLPKACLGQAVEMPNYQVSELAGLVPSNPKHPLPMYQILARILDGSRLEEFKSGFGPTLITGFGRIGGVLCGVVANNGILFSESALKATHFIQLCDRRGIPLLFLQDISGFMVGREYEHGGIAKAGAKMVTAVAGARVPKITLMVGRSYGAGNYGMAGRAYDPRFLFSWPTARIGVMGAQQAASVLSQIKGGGEKEALESQIRAKYERQATAFYASSHLWDDGVILPEETRSVLSLALRIALGAPGGGGSNFGIFRT